MFFYLRVNFLDSLIKRLAQWNVLVGFFLALAGVLLACFARNIVKIIKKTDDVQNYDKMFVTFKFAGLL
ncbi:MAG TPA: hypothetical protein VIL23_04405, partial [Clostridia bacterium]